MEKLISKKKNNKKKGFTLVELIIVIAIIAILAAMAIPKLSSVRTDAKISNDVAAAKNLQTQIAMEVSNNNISVPTADPTTSTAISDAILERLDGKVGTTHKAEAITSGVFKYKVMKNGDIHIYVNDGTKDDELYPDNSGGGRSDYATAAK